jgi:hypothetical protein
MSIQPKIINRTIPQLVFFICFSIILTLIVSFNNVNNDNRKITYKYEKYGEVADSTLCEVMYCSEISYDNKNFKYDKGFLILVEEDYNVTLNHIHLYENIYLDYSEFAIVSSFHGKLIYTDISKLVKNQFFIILYISPLLFLFILVLSTIEYFRERDIFAIKTAGYEAILTNKSIIMISENIHHELNTPLEIIDNKVEKIYNTLKKMYKFNGGRELDIEFDEITRDFEFIKTSSEQIYNVLGKMKGFKNIRYSNGNKNLYEIIYTSLSIMSISNHELTYNIDESIKDIKIKYDTLKNADLLNIFINHIKNSLEANADFIDIKLLESNDISKIFENRHKDIVQMLIRISEPIALFITAIVVLIIALSVVSPMYSIIQQVQNQ